MTNELDYVRESYLNFKGRVMGLVGLEGSAKYVDNETVLHRLAQKMTQLHIYEGRRDDGADVQGDTPEADRG